MSLFTGQASVGTTQAQLLPPRSTRRVAVVRNTHATNGLFIGPDATVTTANGYAVPAGQAVELPGHEGPVHAVASAASTTVSWADVST